MPVPGPGELLLEVGTVGVCGADVGEWAKGRAGDIAGQAVLV